MSRAPIVPAFPPAPRISVLVDYDGTVSRQDVGTVLLAEHALVDQAVVAAKDADYDAGRSGSRDLMQWDMEVLPRDGALLRSFAAGMPQDETFASFVAAVRAAGAAIEIVSDGLGFYVASNLARLDPALVDLPVATNDNDVDGDGRLTFPYGHPACFVCGTCKRERVRAHEADGRVVVFIGDGLQRPLRRAPRRHRLGEGRPARAGARRPAATSWRGTASPRSRPGSSGRSPTAGSRRRQPTCRPGGRRTGPLRPDFICGPEAWGEGGRVPDSLGAPAEATPFGG